jgi:large subunit ribosomal protein L24
MKIKKGDQVLIISGKNKGERGKVLKVFPQSHKILVEGINLRKKHIRPKKAGEKGQVVEMPGPIDISNSKLICPKCGAAVRIGYRIGEKNKFRICKKCGEEL